MFPMRKEVNYVCNKNGQVIGEYFYDADLKLFVAIPLGKLPWYSESAIAAIDIIEQEYEEGA